MQQVFSLHNWVTCGNICSDFFHKGIEIAAWLSFDRGPNTWQGPGRPHGGHRNQNPHNGKLAPTLMRIIYQIHLC